MPQYQFESTRGETCLIYYKIADAPKVGETVTLEGKKWKRVFTVPNAQIAVTIDPFNKQDFINKTGTKTETLGDIFDRSAELSAKRADKDGVDMVKEKYYNDYAKKSKGVQHPNRLREQARKKAEDTNNTKAMRELGFSIKIND